MQVATSPKLVAVAVERGSVTRRLIEEGGGFSVSVLARADRALVRRFVKPVETETLDAAGAATSMQGQPVHEVAGGLPCLTAPALAGLRGALGPPAPGRRRRSHRRPSRATSCSSGRWSTPASGPPAGPEGDGLRASSGWRTPG